MPALTPAFIPVLSLQGFVRPSHNSGPPDITEKHGNSMRRSLGHYPFVLSRPLSPICKPVHFLTEPRGGMKRNFGWLSGKESACQRRRHRFSLWVGRIPWRRKGQPLQCSCLGIPQREEPGGLQSMGSQRARHDVVTKQQTKPRDKWTTLFPEMERSEQFLRVSSLI